MQSFVQYYFKVGTKIACLLKYDMTKTFEQYTSTDWDHLDSAQIATLRMEFGTIQQDFRDLQSAHNEGVRAMRKQAREIDDLRSLLIEALTHMAR